MNALPPQNSRFKQDRVFPDNRFWSWAGNTARSLRRSTPFTFSWVCGSLWQSRVGAVTEGRGGGGCRGEEFISPGNLISDAVPVFQWGFSPCLCFRLSNGAWKPSGDSLKVMLRVGGVDPSRLPTWDWCVLKLSWATHKHSKNPVLFSSALLTKAWFTVLKSAAPSVSTIAPLIACHNSGWQFGKGSHIQYSS